MILRPERPHDAEAIHALVAAAFRTAPHSDGGEAGIVDALRRSGALTLSLVAEEDGALVGHAAFSPVRIERADLGWFGLGPLAVRADRRRRGLGAALVRDGLGALRSGGARGCVVLGDPAYYGRFGFAADAALVYEDAPAVYFQALAFGDPRPAGRVAYAPAFG